MVKEIKKKFAIKVMDIGILKKIFMMEKSNMDIKIIKIDLKI